MAAGDHLGTQFKGATHCKTCGNPLDSFEKSAAPYALQGNCVNCFSSPLESGRRQSQHDMSMSPFTSVQRIDQHLQAAHGLSNPGADVRRLVRGHNVDIHDQTAQYHWRSLHEGLHALGSDHDVSSTHTDPDDPMRL